MAKLMSKKTRENVITSTVLVLVAAFIFFYIIYPLIYVNDMVTRDILNEGDSPVTDSAAAIEQIDLFADTFTVVTDDNIELSSYYINYDSAFDSASGTVVIIPSIFKTKENYIATAKDLAQKGYNVAVYDQRGAGASTGQFHSPGIYEGENLNQFIVWLKLHDRLAKPVTAIGFYTGADAAIYSSESEDYIDNIIAYKPYLTPARWLSSLKDRTGLISFPFSESVYFWWYKKKSGSELERTGVDQMQPVAVSTLVIAPESDLASDEYLKLKEISDKKLSLVKLSETGDDIYQYILNRF